MNKHTEVIELLAIYREMDTGGRKKMVKSSSKLLKMQKALECMQNNEATHQRMPMRTSLTACLVTVPLLLVLAIFFWVVLISPALLLNSNVPLIMLRIIITALLGMFIIGTAIFQFVLKKLTLPWMFLAIIAGLLYVDPGVLTDLIAFVLVALIVGVQFVQQKRAKDAAVFF